MTALQVAAWIGGAAVFAAGFGIGHLRGQVVGIDWAEKNGPWYLAGYREGWRDAQAVIDTFSPQVRQGGAGQ